LIFALHERPDGVETEDGSTVVYDVERNVAFRGPTRVDSPAIAWALYEAKDALVTDRHKGVSALEVEVELDPHVEWIARCDRVDFPPGGVAYRHVHPGPGIRRLLFGELTIDAEDGRRAYGPGDAWFEGAGFPVLATASATEDTGFVRVLILPSEWAGRRTIRYLDPADEEKPKLQRAEVLLEEPLRL
jgi:quercetin dioxygenase-like cupin family protein